MTGLDLDAIKARYGLGRIIHKYEYIDPTKVGTADMAGQARWDVPALVAEVERLRSAVALRGIDADRIARSCATYVEICHRQFSDLSTHEAMVAAVKVAIVDALPDEIARAAGVDR